MKMIIKVLDDQDEPQIKIEYDPEKNGKTSLTSFLSYDKDCDESREQFIAHVCGPLFTNKAVGAMVDRLIGKTDKSK